MQVMISVMEKSGIINDLAIVFPAHENPMIQIWAI